MPRDIFDDSNERLFFCEYMAEKLNLEIGVLAEEAAIQPVIEIESGLILRIVRAYEGYNIPDNK